MTPKENNLQACHQDMATIKKSLKEISKTTSEVLKTLINKKTSHARSVEYDPHRKNELYNNRMASLHELHDYNEFTQGLPIYTSKGINKMIPLIRNWIQYDAFNMQNTSFPPLYTLTKTDHNLIRLHKNKYPIGESFRALFANGYLMKDLKFDFNKDFTKDNLVVEYSTSMNNKTAVDYQALYDSVAELDLDGKQICINWPCLRDELSYIKAIGVYNNPGLVEQQKHVSLLKKKIPLINITDDSIMIPSQETKIQGIALMPNRIREHLHQYVAASKDVVDLKDYRCLNLFDEKLEEDPCFSFIKRSKNICKLPPRNVYNKKSSLFDYDVKTHMKICESETDFYQYLSERGPDEFRAVMLDSKNLSRLHISTELDKEFYNVKTLFKIFKSMEVQWFPLDVEVPRNMERLLHLTSWDIDMLDALKRLNMCDPLKNQRINIRVEMDKFIWQLFQYYCVCTSEIKSRHHHRNRTFQVTHRQAIFTNVLKMCYFENKWMNNMYPNLMFNLNQAMNELQDDIYYYMRDQIVNNKELEKVFPSSKNSLYKDIVGNCLRLEHEVFKTHYRKENRDLPMEQGIGFKDLRDYFRVVVELTKDDGASTDVEQLLKDTYFQNVLKQLTFLDFELVKRGGREVTADRSTLLVKLYHDDYSISLLRTYD